MSFERYIQFLTLRTFFLGVYMGIFLFFSTVLYGVHGLNMKSLPIYLLGGIICLIFASFSTCIYTLLANKVSK